MRIVRFKAAGTIRQGVLDSSHPVEGADTRAGTSARGRRRFTLGPRGCPAPGRPATIVAIGLNDRDHAAEVGTPLPDEPDVSRKPRPALSDPSRRPW
jgi:2-keto-4-pentenoate hydratase/2-oxohepta-3-ene-1,7-dioic acid hydratase in catechol pathway